jgi:hypothetical protein
MIAGGSGLDGEVWGDVPVGITEVLRSHFWFISLGDEMVSLIMGISCAVSGSSSKIRSRSMVIERVAGQ